MVESEKREKFNRMFVFQLRPCRLSRSSCSTLLFIFLLLAGPPRQHAKLLDCILLGSRSRKQEALLVFENEALHRQYMAIVNLRTHSTSSVIGAQFIVPDRRQFAAFPGFLLMQHAVWIRSSYSSALAVGLGSGTLVNFLRRREISTDVIELREDVVRLAAKFFGFDKSRGSTLVGAAQDLLRQISSRYDLIVLDIWSGRNTISVFSVESLREIRATRLLRASSVLVVNVVGFHAGRHSVLVKSIKRTLLTAGFKHVRCFRDMHPDSSISMPTNCACFASDLPVSFKAHLPSMQPLHFNANFEEWEILR